MILVGAGPAGSAAANYLATAGYDVILVDKHKFPRDKICGDFVSPVAQNELSKLGVTRTVEFKSANRISKASVYLDGNKLVSRAVPKVQGLPHYGRVVPRLVLDKLLLDSACRERVVFLENLRALSMRVKRRSVELEAQGPEGKRTLKARLLIGADGSNSTIARIVRGQPPSSADRIIAIRGYFKDVEGPSNQADLHFNKESFPGYCWLFPTGENQANVGVGVAIKKTQEENNNGIKVGLGELSITEIYHTYLTKTYDEVIKRTPLGLPPLSFSTVGLWLIIPDEIREEIEAQGLDFAGGLHAVEHAMIAMSPIFAMCDRWDIGGLSTPLHPDTGEPTIFIYDGFEGGIGISETLYKNIKPLWEKTLELIDNCECKEGCPSCIYSPKCGNENQPLDKKAARVILQHLCNCYKKRDSN